MVRIKSLSYYLPKAKLSNKDILKKIEKSNKNKLESEDLDLLLYSCSRKFEFLGIENRTSCEKNESLFTMAKMAARRAIEMTELSPENIDCIIATGVSNPYREPSLSLLVAQSLGISQCDFLDINDTCNGFVKSMEIAELYLQKGRYKNILLITSENPFEIARSLGYNYTFDSVEHLDRKFSGLIVGSGAAAMILSMDEAGHKIMNYSEHKETADWTGSILTLPGVHLPGFPKETSPGFQTDARSIAAKIINNVPDFIKKTLSKWGKGINDFDYFIMHQLGNNVSFATLDALEINHDKAPVSTFKECGNLASANIPVNLALMEEMDRLKPGDSLLLISSACGLTYSIMHVEW